VKIITGKNVGIIFELNSQTDFVTKNNLFIDLVNDIGNTLLANVDTIDSISKAKRVKLLKSNLLTIEEACHELSAKFGEKILLRRFIIITAKDKEEFLAFYEHSNKRIGTLLLLKGKEENSIVGKDIAMHVAAMSPKFLDKNDIDKQ
jgi:elongation factor Ts